MKPFLPSTEPLRVTEHAICRYLERAMGLNLDIVRDHIAGICTVPAALGAVAVRAEGFRFEIVNNAVVTVVPDNAGAPSRTARDRNQRKIKESAHGSI